MKKSAVDRKVAKIEWILDRMEQGLYTGFTIGWVTDQIAWLYKWRYIDYDLMTHLTAKARYVISTYAPD